MGKEYNKELYKEHVGILESMGVEVSDDLEPIYKEYIKEKMMDMPYMDASVIRMYTLVFFLKYVKHIQGIVKYKDMYKKLEMHKKLISRAMETVEIEFGEKKSNPVLVEDWSSLYSMNKKCGFSVIEDAVHKEKME